MSSASLETHRAVGVDFPELHHAVAVGAEEADLLAVRTPLWAVFALVRVRKDAVVGAVGIHYIQSGAAAVFGHAVVGDVVDDLLMVGREAVFADAAHAPQHFGRHDVRLQGEFFRPDFVFAFRFSFRFLRLLCVARYDCTSDHG